MGRAADVELAALQRHGMGDVRVFALKFRCTPAGAQPMVELCLAAGTRRRSERPGAAPGKRSAAPSGMARVDSPIMAFENCDSFEEASMKPRLTRRLA